MPVLFFSRVPIHTITGRAVKEYLCEVQVGRCPIRVNRKPLPREREREREREPLPREESERGDRSYLVVIRV
jgi:hypothetical protein